MEIFCATEFIIFHTSSGCLGQYALCCLENGDKCVLPNCAGKTICSGNIRESVGNEIYLGDLDYIESLLCYCKQSRLFISVWRFLQNIIQI